MTAAEAGYSAAPARRWPIGAEWLGRREGVDVRVWAPKRTTVEVVWEGEPSTTGPRSTRLEAQGNGYFGARVRDAGVGARYRFRLDGGDSLFADPASRFQPDGPHGPSEVVDPGAFAWTDAGWRGVSKHGQVIYEMHLGTFTPEGTWSAAAGELRELARLGITIVEVMPIADFPGRFGWGYDGVGLFAPSRLYGRPDEVRRFVDAAHALGIGVILDVVYNHLGPDGNYLAQFSDTYFTDRYKTDWGPALNYDGEGSHGTRELIVTNAAYWIDEFHFDGLRLDATQNIYDASGTHVLSVIGRAVHSASRGRGTIIVAENETQETALVRAEADGGYGLDGLWNDDLHHAARVALTGRSEAYYEDYAGSPQELLSAIKWGFLFQGQHYAWQGKRRGLPALDVVPERFVTYLENHDQVSNSTHGERLAWLSAPAKHRALVLLVLLGPGTPMIFQGEEFASTKPFVFFADHHADLAALVREGRKNFLSQFPSIGETSAKAEVPDPADPATFERCKLDFGERLRHAKTYALYKDLIALRRRDPTFRAPRLRGVDGAVLTSSAFVARFFGDTPGLDRLVVVNLGADVRLPRAPEPLLAPPSGRLWRKMLSSEDAAYGGGGCAPLERDGVWHLPGETAVVLEPAKGEP